MLKLFRSKIFLKEYSKVKFTDKHYMKYVVYITTLLKKDTLPFEAHDHSLQGNYVAYREFHISGDLLVVYKIEDAVLKLTRIGTHAQLFKQHAN
jgi:mRNA interferase YafQ